MYYKENDYIFKQLLKIEHREFKNGDICWICRKPIDDIEKSEVIYNNVCVLGDVVRSAKINPVHVKCLKEIINDNQ